MGTTAPTAGRVPAAYGSARDPSAPPREEPVLCRQVLRREEASEAPTQLSCSKPRSCSTERRCQGPSSNCTHAPSPCARKQQTSSQWRPQTAPWANGDRDGRDHEESRPCRCGADEPISPHRHPPDLHPPTYCDASLSAFANLRRAGRAI